MQAEPFIHAFFWLIVVPIVLSALVQKWTPRSRIGERAATALVLLPVPATARVLFVVIAAVVPQLEPAINLVACRAVPQSIRLTV